MPAPALGDEPRTLKTASLDDQLDAANEQFVPTDSGGVDGGSSRRSDTVAAMMIESFPPLLGRRPRVLVLGSMPGVASLQAQRYYAHPRNLFWPIMARLCGFDPDLPYRQRTRELTASGVALWDVLASCERPGSLDAAIVRTSERANPIGDLLARQAGIAAVACNGGTALALFRRHVLRELRPDLRERIEVLALPSTSPANASMSPAQREQAWQQLAPWLREQA